MQSPRDTKKFDDLVFARRKEKKISEQISEELVQTFVTGLEREDIEALARGLYKIPKSAEKLAERFMMAGKHVEGIDFSKQAEMMEKATAASLNHPAASYNLGLIHLNGLGVAKDEKQAASEFKRCIREEAIPIWIKIVCALTMAAGTAAGGWRIIKTLGHKMVKLHPVHGFAAEATGASVLMTAAHFGMPVSTTHAITTSIMGVGCAKGFNALKFSVVKRILWAWVLTIPASGSVAYGLVKLGKACGWIG